MSSTVKIKPVIMAVDDENGILLSIKATLMGAGLPEPITISDSRLVLQHLEDSSFQVILLDLRMPHMDGIDLLRQIKTKYPQMECIIVTAENDLDQAVAAIKYGAYDYLVKPVGPDRLVITVERALERYSLSNRVSMLEHDIAFSDIEHLSAFKEIVAEDEAMAQVFKMAETSAPTDYSVMISGESGTGKELLAHAIHRLSLRNTAPFVAVNMAALSPATIEDALFGHKKGAFTGASDDQKGFFLSADGGTLFLDEVTELGFELQAKLLRVIQEKELYRLGSTIPEKIDLRLISASNRNIEEAVKAGSFRADLFYRINTCHIKIPPLRDRQKDILPLAHHFLKIHSEKNKKTIKAIDPHLSDILEHYTFPGNVRELQNIISSAILLETSDTLMCSSVRSLQSAANDIAAPGECFQTLMEMEKSHILTVLKANNNNRSKASKILGIGIRTLQRKLKKYESPATPS